MAGERSDDANRAPQVRVDTYTKVCLTAIAVLLTLMVVGLWTDMAPMNGELGAAEKFLDTSAQRKAAVEQAKLTNAKLDQLISMFSSGQAKVRVVDDKAGQAGGKQVAPRKNK